MKSLTKYYNALSNNLGAIGAMVVFIGISILVVTILPFIVGWSLVAIIGLFGTVQVAGYFSYVGIGIAVMILAAILK